MFSSRKLQNYYRTTALCSFLGPCSFSRLITTLFIASQQVRGLTNDCWVCPPSKWPHRLLKWEAWRCIECQYGGRQHMRCLLFWCQTDTLTTCCIVTDKTLKWCLLWKMDHCVFPASAKQRRSVSARRTCCSLSATTWLPRRGKKTWWTTTPRFHVSHRELHRQAEDYILFCSMGS